MSRSTVHAATFGSCWRPTENFSPIACKEIRQVNGRAENGRSKGTPPMSMWRRDRDSDLERELRAGRPEPRAEVTQEIADRVRPRRNGFTRGLDRVPLGVAGVLS